MFFSIWEFFTLNYCMFIYLIFQVFLFKLWSKVVKGFVGLLGTYFSQHTTLPNYLCEKIQPLIILAIWSFTFISPGTTPYRVTITLLHCTLIQPARPSSSSCLHQLKQSSVEAPPFSPSHRTSSFAFCCVLNTRKRTVVIAV